jgi:hypothetical protein
VDAGLPIYLALERKPDNGGEIQNLADVASGIMLHLKVVKSANEEKAIAVAAAADAIADDDDITAADEAGKGTQVLLLADGAVASFWSPHHRRRLLCFGGGGVGDEGEGPYLHWQREAVQQAVSYGIPWEYNPPTTRITSDPCVN